MCMASQAVHIKITHSLDSDSFIQALRQVITLRGNIKVLHSDNGTNFIGCANELKKAFKEMDYDRIQSFMESLGGDLIRWIRNPSAASHMGDIWESQIRSAHVVLSSLLSTHGKLLDEESLLALVGETEGMVDLWPLTVEIISNPTSDLPLAPSNILTVKSKVAMPPPGDFSRSDLCC